MSSTHSVTKEKNFIPYGCSVHGQNEIDTVVHCLQTSTQIGYIHKSDRSFMDQL